MERKIKNSSNRSFGLLFFIVFIIIGLFPLIDMEKVRTWSIIISLIFLLLGIINSKFLTPLKILWIKFGFFIGKYVSIITMGIIFFLIITPIGLLMRLLGKDLLRLKKNNSNSYWLKKDNQNSSMKNQF